MGKNVPTDISVSDLMDLFRTDGHAAFLRGHLVVEAVLFVMLRNASDPPSNRKLKGMSFATAVEACLERNILTNERAALLKNVNAVRNRMAHELRYRFRFDVAFELVQEAAAADIDFSDGTVFGEKAEAERVYGTEGLIQELFQNLAQDILFDSDPSLEGPVGNFWSS